MSQLRPTRVEIDLSAIAGNIKALRARTQAGAQLMAVVKADAYGHGAVPVAQVALRHGAQALGVAIVEEGVQLREAGVSAPILVFGGIPPKAAEAVVRYGLTQAVFDERTVAALAQAAQAQQKPARVHIKVDSGMGRIGVRDVDALRRVANAVADSSGMRLEGMFTHFATADAEDLGYVQAQYARFARLVEALRQRAPGIIVHACNSAATLRCPAYHHDMVRTGIAQYVCPDLPEGADTALRQAMRWVTQAVHVKEIAPGEAVSYGSVFRAERPTRVMTIPVGYADGYHRAIGGRGYALVRGQAAPVIGRVCMDQAMLDVTDIPGASIGDEVVLLGGQGDAFISAHEMGGWCGMIDYEIVLSPTGRVPRVYLHDQA